MLATTNSSDRHRPGAGSGPSLLRAVLAQAAGGALLGLGVAALTVRLDPELAHHRGDVWMLLAWGVGFYAFGWLLVTLVPTLLLVGAANRYGPEGRGHGLASAARRGLALVPLLYLVLLPQVGLAGDLLSTALFARGVRLVLTVAVAAAAVLLLGAAASRFAAWRRAGVAAGWLWLVGAASLALVALTVRPPQAPDETAPELGTVSALDFESGELPAQALAGDDVGDVHMPLFLLCIDGADPHVLRQLLDRGELPAFQQLARRGTWGELTTLRPTLSPVVWTTLITGRAPDDHGIHQFVHFRLPGVRSPILQFPLHSGLNFTLVRRLESAFGVSLRSPYTTAMRRVPALWNIVERTHRVGVYRWLMTWPAEEVNGYFVSGGIAWAHLKAQHGRTFHPPVLRRLLKGQLSVPRDADIEALFGFQPAPGALRRKVAGALRDPTVAELARLTERYRPLFTAASFFPVDATQHLYGHLRGTDDPQAGAVDGYYRLADARLGELLARLGDDVRILVVSDHGYDFEHGHHANQPPGIFFAAGQGIAAGREVTGLEVYDVTPLALRLLDLPLADDMPGTLAGRYQRVLDPQWAAAHPERRIASWRGGGYHRDTERLVDPEVEEVLRELGYVE